MKNRIILILLLYSVSANAECKDLKNQLDNYETACKITTDLTSGCGVLATATATFSFGFWGLLCAVPSVVGSGVCAMRDIKQRWYDACLEGVKVPAWAKMTTKTPPNKKKGHDRLIFIRHLDMEENNALYERKVDEFLEAYSEIDMTIEQNKKIFDEKMAQFEQEYIDRAKEIEEQFQKDVLKS